MSTAYERYQDQMEQEVLAILACGSKWFDQFTDAGHWLACHRLVNKGLVKESLIANSFQLV